MSHFVILVLSPEKPDDPQDYVETLLEPYSESLEVDPYMRDCYCVGLVAERQVREEVTKELGSINDIRDAYWKEIETQVKARLGDLPYGEANAETFHKTREEIVNAMSPAWEQRIQPILDRQAALLEKHPEKGKPDSECEECSGTGKNETTYNPKSKWDWWTIGGRWTGYLRPDYDPTQDPRNLETCFLCRGTGKRDDELGREQRVKDPTYTCNGCSGKGQSVVFPSKYVEPPEGGNIAPVSQVLKLLDAGEKVLPFALVRPTGEWLEKGNMGWWAIVSNEKENWSQAARSVLEEYADHWVVVVDCHI